MAGRKSRSRSRPQAGEGDQQMDVVAPASPAVDYEDDDGDEYSDDEASPRKPNEPHPEDEGRAADDGASMETLITVVGAIAAGLLAVVAVWCLVMLPVNIVAWVNDRPPHADTLFALARCLNEASAARVLTTADTNGVVALHDCLDAAMDHNDGPDIPGVSTALQRARAAVNSGDVTVAEVQLKAALDAAVTNLRNKVGDQVAASWAPALRVLAAAVNRKYARARAVPAGSPPRESVPAAVAGFGAGAAVLNRLRVPAAPDAVTAAAAAADSAAAIDGRTAAASTLQFRQFPQSAEYTGVHTEALAGIDALHGVIRRAGGRYDADEATQTAEIATTSILLILGAVVCMGAAVWLMVLARRFSAVEQYRRVIRADFEVEEDSPRAIPRPEVLRAFSLAAAKFSVLDTTPDAAIDGDTSQLVLHLVRAKSTLAALRPFVPAFCYAHGLNFEAFGRLYPRLDMACGLTKDTAATVVVVGLRDFNNASAVLDSLPTFVAAIHIATETNDGVVAQVTPTHAVLLFKTAREDDAEMSVSNRAQTSSAAPAIRAAFSILASGVQLQSDDPTLSISIAVSHGCCLHGPIATVSARSYAVVSHILTTALHLEGMCRQLGACLLSDSETANAVEETVLSRPVWLCPSRQTNVHEIVMPLDSINDGNAPAEVRAERAAVRDRVARWQQCFEKYEDAINSMAHDKVEEASGDLHAFRQFVSAQTGSSDSAEDVVFRRVADHLRRLMSDLKI